MPRLIDETMETGTIAGLQKFQFSSVRIEHLGATEYTLVNIAVDTTGSVAGFEDDLRKAVVAAVEDCKKSPRSDNLLLRVIEFSTSLPNSVKEVHGFKLLAEIDPNNDYPQFKPSGTTPLFDAAFSAIGATTTLAEKLTADDFLVNGIVFIITDGADNASTISPAMIKEQVEKAIKEEHLESLVTILIGINVSGYRNELEAFRVNAGINQYVDVGEVKDGTLAELAGFVSQSVSSQSQALGTGGPSQNIPATI